MRSDVLVIDDDSAVQGLLAEALGRHTSLSVACASSSAEGVARFSALRPATVLLDVQLPDGNGLDLMDLFLGLEPETRIFVLSGQSGSNDVVRAVKRGAADFFEKPIPLARLLSRVQERLLVPRPSPGGMRGHSPGLRRVLERLRRVAPTQATVVVTGETGTGKELVARTLHQLSQRASGPFVAINCSAFPAALLEAELFGYERGAFTGAATSGKAGLFEAAHGGTILLDEIGDAPMPVQTALLRVLEQRAVRRVGGVLETPVDARVIAATNKDLQAEVAAGRFRADLFFRLRVIEVAVPPLRERPEDVAFLARHFLELEARCLGRPLELSAEAVAALEAHRWPGNVRELRNVIESAAVLASGPVISTEELDILPPVPCPNPCPFLPQAVNRPTTAPAEPESLRLDDAERRLLIRALAISSGNRRQAAVLLGVNRTTIYNMCKRHRVGEESALD